MSKRKKYFYTISLTLILALGLGVNYSLSQNSVTPKNALALSNNAVRGVPGDLWADIEVGQRDFSEISAREIVEYKLNNPGGVAIDISSHTEYVWDSGNNRILGFNVDECSSSVNCNASIVIGQPTNKDYGACNQDASYQYYPNRAPASASTLCAVRESTQTTLEDKSFVTMYVDELGTLFVPDIHNHRILKYVDPSVTDSVADDVWGQTDFTLNQCNNGLSAPTASTLCFISIGVDSTGGVTLDASGNMWVADAGNNRVLRFTRNLSTNSISKTADLVIGQANFTTGGDWSYGTSLDRMHGPSSLRFDNSGNLYVTDAGNHRVLKFSAPFSSGMTGTLFGQNFQFNDPKAVEFDPSGPSVFISDTSGWNDRITQWNLDGSLKQTLPMLPNRGGGSMGISPSGDLYATSYVYGQSVHRFTKQSDASYLQDQNLFSSPAGYNLTSGRRLEHAAWTGVAVAGDQLIVSDGRLLFYNGVNTLMNGQPADGYLGTGNINQIPDPAFGQVKTDLSNRVWVTKKSEIQVYQAPLSSQASTIARITSPINTLEGSQLSFSDVYGIAPTSDGNYLWVSEPSKHRVFRIANPLSNPLVDVVLGQQTLTGATCNRGVVSAPSQNPNRTPDQDAKLDMLCYPGALSLDKQNNLYVSDHFIEVDGNWRLLMFSSTLFPATPSSIIYAPFATKEFPRYSGTSNPYVHMTFEPAFNSANKMIVGYNPYSGKRFIEFYSDPTKVNPLNPSDPAYAAPDGQFKDFYGWPVAMTFDSNDNLYAYDANRGKVMIYKTPSLVAPTPTATAVPTATATIPPQTPTPTTLPTATVIPTVPSTPTPSGTTLKIYAAGQPYNNKYPTMVLTINGSDVKTFTNVKGDAAKGTFVEYIYTSTKVIPSTQVRVRFTNDSNTMALRIDRININGKDYQTEASTTNTKSSSSSCPSGYLKTEWLNCNGYFQY